ncbi:MAG TPA: hypothetical protein VFB78_18935 [Acidimicrobiales bacterium]|nr:hypothetical protein [Acidimicrobiales bacterium]
MAYRRLAITALATAVALALPACRFSRSDKDASSSSSTTSTIDTFGDLTDTSLGEETTTSLDESATTTTARGTTTSRKPTVTTKPAPRPVTTTPGCQVSVSAPDTTVGQSEFISVSSTFPNRAVEISLSAPGYTHNTSNVTDSSGSYGYSQHVDAGTRGQTVNVSVSVGGRSCNTSFRVS